MAEFRKGEWHAVNSFPLSSLTVFKLFKYEICQAMTCLKIGSICKCFPAVRLFWATYFVALIKEDFSLRFKSSFQRCSVKMEFFKISRNSQGNICVKVSFLIKLQELSCEFCKIFKNTFFYRTPQVAVFGNLK